MSFDGRFISILLGFEQSLNLDDGMAMVNVFLTMWEKSMLTFIYEDSSDSETGI